MPIPTNLGYPRIGPNRELKRALEGYWRGTIAEAELLEAVGELRSARWREQADQGIAQIPSGDLSLYDHVLDTAVLVGAIPARFGWRGGPVGLETYFAMARGLQERQLDSGTTASAPALEMTKWFDTNYHYLVPEFHAGQEFQLTSTAPVDEFLEARTLGIAARPVLLGPVSFLLLGKAPAGDIRPIELLDALLPVYIELLTALAAAGADWVQIDEPCLVLDLDDTTRAAFHRAYTRLAEVPDLKLLVTTYFGGLGENLPLAFGLPVAGVHLDLVRAPWQFDTALASVPPQLTLSLGVIDGRNVWRADLDAALSLVRRAIDRLGPERVMVAPSCSLLHVPVDLEAEPELDDEVRGWLAFARQKLYEIRALADAARSGDAAAPALLASRAARESRRRSKRAHRADLRERLTNLTPEHFRRESPFALRQEMQRLRLGLPPLPTTTIGSFPQTPEVRRRRAAFLRGESSAAEYDEFIAAEIEAVVRFQEEVGLDVVVHGEPERSDMVEYFGERLEGFLCTRNGWVQSYGSRSIRPPIIYGDVSRPAPMTVRWSRYAQSLTSRPMKGMLTGPVTILQWSFVRDDQPRADTCRQIALAIRDEVRDLAEAGLPMIQIDEPALREGLPLRRAEQPAYLEWAVDAFRLAAAGAPDDTQIHTHMCYSEFDEILDAIIALDADVLSIEASRSRMELLGAFRENAYPNEIGPGVYDIHSPRVPTTAEVRDLLEAALAVISPDQLWVNPDCGLKTRRWEEVRPSLEAMVRAAREVRATVPSGRVGAPAG